MKIDTTLPPIHHAPFSGLIFDFNGVLFWDDLLQRKSWRKFTAQLRDAPLTDEEIETHVHGRNGKHTMQYLLGHTISQARADELTEAKEFIYRQMCLALDGDFRLSPGAVNLLDILVERQIPHTIATASDKNNVDFFVEHLELGRWFEIDKIVYDNGQIAGKPAPDLYLKAAKNLNLTPEKCVVVEDSHSGIQAAHKAGVGHLIALGPKATHEALAQLEGVDQVIRSLNEVNPAKLFES